MHYDFRRIGDGRQAVLRETTRAVTPFGGLVVLIELARKLELVGFVREHLPFRYRSNHASQPEHILLALNHDGNAEGTQNDAYRDGEIASQLAGHERERRGRARPRGASRSASAAPPRRRSPRQ